jgi:DNA-directed RNA polymerase beta subunit
MAKQVTPTNGNERPLVGTGGEFIIPQISSKRFIQKATNNGVVEEVVENKYITVKYNDGTRETFDIYPRLSKTKMNNYISLEMKTLPVGEKINTGQPVAWTKTFDNTGAYCAGKNCWAAIMQYNGMGHEDAYCVSSRIANKMTRDILREVSVVIPPDTKVINLEKEIGKTVTNEDILAEFSYDDGIDKYLDNYEEIDVDIDGEESSNQNSLKAGRNSIKFMAKNGIITDIKVFINNKNSVDKQIVKFHSDMVNDTKQTIGKIAASYKNKNDMISASDNISLKFMKFGGHKLKGGIEFLGARIVYYIKQEIPLMAGDKLATRTGAKGVISVVLDDDKTPYGKFSNEKLEVFISPTTVFSRKAIAPVKELYIGKIMHYLNLKVKEMVNNVKIKTNDINKLILDVYKTLSNDKDVIGSVEKFLKINTESKLRKLYKDETFKLFFVIPPFSKVEFESIKSVGDLLEIELDEYVYLPEFERFTKVPVPVGILYYSALEQTSDVYASSRSTGSYQSITGQPTKGKSKGGGQSLGQLDFNALLTYNADKLIDELITIRADDHKGKRHVINSIISTGRAELPKDMASSSDTKNVFDVFMTTMGLHVSK